MAVFIEARTDPFVERREAEAEAIRNNGRPHYPVRRPLRGIEVKEDTYGTIRVALADGGFLPVIDAAGDILTTRDGKAYTTHYTNFLIQSVQEDRREKQQIVETFGDAYIFFYGEAPRILQVQGLLLNTADFNWRAEWWENYERYFRGTRLVEYGARIYLMYDDIIVEGYMLGASATDDAQRPEVIPLNFQLFVSGYTNVSLIGDPNFPRPEGDIDYTNPTSYDEALRQYEQSRNIQGEMGVDAVQGAEGRFGSGALLSDSLRNGLATGDPSIAGFLNRSSTALGGSSSQNVRTASGTSTVDRPNSSTSRALRGTFRDNVDEFLNMPVSSDSVPTQDEGTWSQTDAAIDNAAVEEGINPTDSQFHDLMGRSGRADSEIAAQEGPRRLNDGVYQTGSTRSLRSGTTRSIPFGMGVFEDDPISDQSIV